MTRSIKWLAISAVIVLALASGIGSWLLVRGTGTKLPTISLFSDGQALRVGPYLYCNVVDLNDCQAPQVQGELRVGRHHPVQLSVPAEIARAPWRLLEVYDDVRDSPDLVFRPDSQLAVTIPTFDPKRGRLRGIAVQLLTLIQDPAGNLIDFPHAEWSVRTVWSDG
jgi:hypothetical protein